MTYNTYIRSYSIAKVNYRGATAPENYVLSQQYRCSRAQIWPIRGKENISEQIYGKKMLKLYGYE